MGECTEDRFEEKEEDLLCLLFCCFWSRCLLREDVEEHVAQLLAVVFWYNRELDVGVLDL